MFKKSFAAATSTLGLSLCLAGCVAGTDVEGEPLGTAEQAVCTDYSISSATLDDGATATGSLENTYDGDTGTHWQGELDAEYDNPVVTWDLGSSETIDQVQIDWGFFGAVKFDILGSTDGTNFTLIHDDLFFTTNDATSTHSIDGTYRYIRIDFQIPEYYLGYRSSIVKELHIQSC